MLCCAVQSEVPQIPYDELQEAAQLMLQQQQQLAAAAAAAQQQQQVQQKQIAQTTSGEIIEIDDWLVDFANLFREMSGIDADRCDSSSNSSSGSTPWACGRLCATVQPPTCCLAHGSAVRKYSPWHGRPYQLPSMQVQMQTRWH